MMNNIRKVNDAVVGTPNEGSETIMVYTKDPSLVPYIRNIRKVESAYYIRTYKGILVRFQQGTDVYEGIQTVIRTLQEYGFSVE